MAPIHAGFAHASGFSLHLGGQSAGIDDPNTVLDVLREKLASPAAVAEDVIDAAGVEGGMDQAFLFPWNRGFSWATVLHVVSGRWKPRTPDWFPGPQRSTAQPPTVAADLGVVLSRFLGFEAMILCEALCYELILGLPRFRMK